MIRAALAALLTTLALQAAPEAMAYWTAAGTGAAFGMTDTLGAGNQPGGVASGSTVTVSWAQTIFDGLPLGGYLNGGYNVRATRRAAVPRSPPAPAATQRSPAARRSSPARRRTSLRAAGSTP